jgi:hypothetical protein
MWGSTREMPEYPVFKLLLLFLFSCGISSLAWARGFSAWRALAVVVAGFLVLDFLSSYLLLNADRWQIGGPATWAWIGGIAAYYRVRTPNPPPTSKPTVRRRAVVWLGFSVAAGLSALLVVLQMYGPVKGLYWRSFRTPTILRAAFIEEFDPKSARADSQRKRLWEIWKLAKGSYGLRMTFSSIEGQAIGQCIAIEEGTLSYVYDATRDSYGPRRFLVGHPVELVLGAPAHSEVSVMDEMWPDSKRTYLKVKFRSGRTFFF